VDEQKAFEAGMRKPFWEGEYGTSFLRKFADAADYMQSVGIQPGQRLLELGCGAGWVAEFFVLLEDDVTATLVCQAPLDHGAEKTIAGKRISIT